MIATLDGVVNAPLRGPLACRAWAIGAAAGLVAPLARRLAEDGIQVLDVPAKLGAPGPYALHRSRPQERRGRLLSVGIAARTPSEPGHGMPGRCRCRAARSRAPGRPRRRAPRAYAHCIDGQADVANRRIADVLDPMKGSPPDTASLERWRQRHSGRSSHSRVTAPTRWGGMHRYASAVAGECQSRRVPSTV